MGAGGGPRAGSGVRVRRKGQECIRSRLPVIQAVPGSFPDGFRAPADPCHINFS